MGTVPKQTKPKCPCDSHAGSGLGLGIDPLEGYGAGVLVCQLSASRPQKGHPPHAVSKGALYLGLTGMVMAVRIVDDEYNDSDQGKHQRPMTIGHIRSFDPWSPFLEGVRQCINSWQSCFWRPNVFHRAKV